MTDATLRSLARDAAAGDQDAAVRLLLARERIGWRWSECPRLAGDPLGHVGALGAPPDCPLCRGTGYATPRAGIELAAYLGDPVAREYVPVATKCVYFEDRLSFASWGQGLATWGPETITRAAIAAGWVACEAWANSRDGRGGDGTSYWLRRNKVNGQWQWMFTTADGVDVISLESAPDGYWRYRPLHALQAAEAHVRNPTEETREAWRVALTQCGPPDWLLFWEFSKGTTGVATAIQAAARLTGEAAVRTAIRDALVPWCLGVE